MVRCFACAVKHRKDVMSLGSNVKRKVKVKCNTSMHQPIIYNPCVYCQATGGVDELSIAISLDFCRNLTNLKAQRKKHTNRRRDNVMKIQNNAL